VKLALGGDTMLGRGVAERLETEPADSLFAPELVELVREADLVVLNLECCISARGEPTPGRVFHFRAPPRAAQALAHLGVDCVTLANNHALDFGPDALLDTLAHLDAAGIRAVGAGTDLERARTPAVLDAPPVGCQTRRTSREISDLRAGRQFWYPTRRRSSHRHAEERRFGAGPPEFLLVGLAPP
jgi:Bacterial capsule synthesis protein PGA_cap